MGKKNDTVKEMAQHLRRELAQRLGLESTGTLKDLFPGPMYAAGDSEKKKSLDRAAYISDDEEGCELLALEHFDFKVSGVVRDDRYGSLGFIHFVRAEKSADTSGRQEAESKLEEKIRRQVEEAAYIRHLLIQQKEANRKPYFIEVVFVVLDWEEGAARVAAALRVLMQRSSLLHTVGVNLLAGESCDQTRALRRAFSWLLTAVEHWYGERVIPKKKEAQGTGGLDQLDLWAFRVPGERSWKFAKDYSLQIVHGPNGTGKSTLTEALELLLTGKIRRIEEKRKDAPAGNAAKIDYRKVITNDSVAAGAVAQIRVQGTFDSELCNDLPSGEWLPLNEDGLPKKLHRNEFPADAFRIDQTLSDQLGSGTAADRAKIFLEAFFPDQGPEVRKRNRAEDHLAVTRAELHTLVRSRFESGIQRVPDLSWVAKGTVSAAEVFDLIPGGGVLARLLSERLSGPAEEWLRGKEGVSVTMLHTLWPAIDGAWRQLQEEQTRLAQMWTETVALLKELNECEFSKSKTIEGENVREVLNHWLETHVLYELVKNERDVCCTLLAVPEGTWHAPADLGLPTVNRQGKLSEQLNRSWQQLRQRRAQLDEQVKTLKSGTGDKKAIHGTRLSVNPDEVHLLDRAAKTLGLVTSETGESVGTSIRKAFNAQKPLTLRTSKTETSPDFVLGHPHQLGSLIENAQAIVKALTEMPNTSTGLNSIGQVVEKVMAFKRAEEDLAQANQEVVQEFEKRIKGPLNDALNELISLMTPARWAYQDVESEVEGRGQEVSFKVSGVQTDLKLNTAELNTLTMALFLLCAIREDNPLRMMVFDDPLQNMDELTTTVVARAVARILEVWHHMKIDQLGWRIIMLLHGEENVDRFRAEARCVIYYLPWLTPVFENRQTTIDDPPIQSEPSVLQEARLALKKHLLQSGA